MARILVVCVANEAANWALVWSRDDSHETELGSKIEDGTPGAAWAGGPLSAAPARTVASTTATRLRMVVMRSLRLMCLSGTGETNWRPRCGSPRASTADPELG
jgi:hypothetical protein